EGALTIGGTQRIGVEGVFDVGGGEFKVLLFVLEAERDAAQRLVLCALFEQAGDAGVDMFAVGEDQIKWWPRKAGPQPLLRHIAECLVVAVEEPAEVRVKGLVRRYKLAEDEGLEE